MGEAWVTQVGERFVGEGRNAAHVNVVFGVRGRPVEIARRAAPARPRIGHVPFVVVRLSRS